LGPAPQADNARIRGSEAIERLRIDSRFCMRFVTELQWSTAASPAGRCVPRCGRWLMALGAGCLRDALPPPPGSPATPSHLPGCVPDLCTPSQQVLRMHAHAHAPHHLALCSSVASGASYEDDAAVMSTPGEISGGAQLDVWCEVIPPFNIMPRQVLEVGGQGGQGGARASWGGGREGGRGGETLSADAQPFLQGSARAGRWQLSVR
jgi:hypothetical protein